MKVLEIYNVKTDVIRLDPDEDSPTYLRMFQTWNNDYVWYKWGEQGWELFKDQDEKKQVIHAVELYEAGGVVQ